MNGLTVSAHIVSTVKTFPYLLSLQRILRDFETFPSSFPRSVKLLPYL